MVSPIWGDVARVIASAKASILEKTSAMMVLFLFHMSDDGVMTVPEPQV